MPGRGDRAGAGRDGARPAGRVSGSVASTPSVASPEPGQPRPRRGTASRSRRPALLRVSLPGSSGTRAPALRGAREGHGTAAQAPRPCYLLVSGQPAARPRSPLPGPSAFEPLNYGSESFSQVRESRGGPAGQIFLPLGTSPSEDTGHHAPWNYTLNTQRGRPQHRPWTFCCWKPCCSCL